MIRMEFFVLTNSQNSIYRFHPPSHRVEMGYQREGSYHLSTSRVTVVAPSDLGSISSAKFTSIFTRNFQLFTYATDRNDLNSGKKVFGRDHQKHIKIWV